MAGILTLKSTNSLDVLRAHWRFALARLKSDTNAAPYVADFTAFGPQWSAADQKEAILDDAVTDADAAAVAANAVLDALVDRLTIAIHPGKKVNVTLPLHKLYFGSLTPSQFKRPILGAKLQKQQGWPALLAQATQPALQALAAPVTAAVTVGNAAAKALDDAITLRGSFRLGGARAKAFDAFNAICAKAYGGLKAFAHAHPELGLTPSYGASFFMGSVGGTHGGVTLAKTATASTHAAAKAAKAQATHDVAVKAAAAKTVAAQDRQHKLDAAKVAAKVAKDAVKAAKAAKDAAKRKRKS